MSALLLSITVAISTGTYEPFDKKCLKEQLKSCGKQVLIDKIELTPDEKYTLLCRVKALNKCRNRVPNE